MKKLLSKLFKSKEEIIVVSGLPRSGTSMMMKMLDAAGIPPLTDNIRTADDDNPKGYYEFERAKKLKEGDVAWLPDAQGKVVKIIGALLVELPANYKYKVLFMRRKMDEILASQNKMLARRGEDQKVDDETIAKLFQKHIQQVEFWMQNQPNLDYLDVEYNEMLKNPKPQVEAIVRFLGREMDIDTMAAIVDPELYRQRK
ncbi:MAG: sulfotransferase domain-containing protein [Chloroflexi bacterium]|nr:sulfotransferase domain-containing protein [Chloroflexota bacterium]